MKYFTIDQWIVDQEPETSAEPGPTSYEQYLTYVDGIRPQLPAEFQPLTREVILHDARLVAMKATTEESTVKLTLTPGPHTDRDWVQLELLYIGVGRVHFKSDPDKGLAGPNGFGDLGYDEIELLGGGMFEHRMLFSSGIELSIEFAAFHLERHQK